MAVISFQADGDAALLIFQFPAKQLLVDFGVIDSLFGLLVVDVEAAIVTSWAVED